MKKARFAILLTMTCGPLMSGARAATVFYVSLKGKDQWSGRLADPNAAATDGPFATLERARDAVREVKRAGLTTPVDVVVRGGVYDLPQTFVLTPEDSGRPDCPVTWRGQEGERPMIRGARRVTGWQPWRDGIWRADLKAQGMGGVTFHQLFFRGAGAKPTDFSQRLILARYPNFDPEHPITGGNVYMPGSVGTVQERCHEVYYTEGALPLDQWQDMSQAEVVSTYNRGWHFAITPILSVDRAAHILNVQPVRGEFIKLNRFFIQNVLDALDAPGEWYLDYRESVLYLYPPAGESLDKSEVLVPCSTT
ncbi:MAG: hypothetical protein NTW86_30365 [Candidatus Sumerlaeota bacterium]|nr:hypothetical protein [Candidatus Sumerlaeota bacterium]